MHTETDHAVLESHAAAPESLTLAPRARLYGEPVTALPRDLFIPPEALEVVLQAFEGPLDLLLYLIRKQNLDILDIPMADLTRQYIAYIEALQASRLELAADYLLMAAMLIDIKSRMLLPQPPSGEDEEPEDPRAELVRRLLEYEQMRAAATDIDALPQAGRNFEWVQAAFETGAAPPPGVSTAELMDAWRSILARARANTHHRISRETLSVREHMARVLKVLREAGMRRLTELLDVDGGVPHLVVTFLAILELVREGLARLTQAEALAPIYITLPEGA
jgi:segregation and condensation protein A